jgi:hypothetical protein
VNSGNVSNSCSSIDTRHLIVVANSVINNEWGKDRITIKTTMCVVFVIIYTRVLMKKRSSILFNVSHMNLIFSLLFTTYM